MGIGLVSAAAFGATAYALPSEILKIVPLNSVLFSRAAQNAVKQKEKPKTLQTFNPAKINDSAQTSPKIPTQITYLFLFKRVDNLDKKATDEEAKGKDGKVYRQHYKDKAKLTDAQNDALFKVAKDCLKDVSKIDDAAQEIIDKLRAKYPGGKINSGDAPPTLPIELTELKQKRDDIVLSYINVLKESFSDVDFIKFQRFVEEDITSQISITNSTNNLRPATQNRNSGAPMLPETSSEPKTVELKEQK